MIDFDLVEPAVLTGFVREAPAPFGIMLNRFLPDRPVSDIEVAWNSVLRTNRAAQYRAWDTETPVGKRDSMTQSRVMLPALGVKTVLGEEERLMLERVRSGGDNTARLTESIYDDAATNTRATLLRMELARGDVLTDGKFTLAGENGLTVEVDYGVDSSHLVTAGTAWSNAATADPIADLRTWSDVYTDDAGEPPAYALTSRTVVGHLLRNEKVRAYASSLAGTPSIVTRAQLNTILDAHGLPQIVEYHSMIDVGGSSTRPIPADRVALLPANPESLGYTAWGITPEALELAGGTNPQLIFEDLPGLVGVVMREGDPVRTWTKVTASGMPVITDPRRLLVADVL